jgi:hypothetical protein
VGGRRQLELEAHILIYNEPGGNGRGSCGAGAVIDRAVAMAVGRWRAWRRPRPRPRRARSTAGLRGWRLSRGERGGGSRRGGQAGRGGMAVIMAAIERSEKEAAGRKGENNGAELYGWRRPAPCDAKGVSRGRENLWSMQANDCERNILYQSAVNNELSCSLQENKAQF